MGFRKQGAVLASARDEARSARFLSGAHASSPQSPPILCSSAQRPTIECEPVRDCDPSHNRRFERSFTVAPTERWSSIMTTEREKDPDATVKMPLPLPRMDGDTDDFDPEKTLVREDWESVRKDIMHGDQP